MYAGFWLRVVAYFIDYILLSILYYVLVLILGQAALIPTALLGWLYYALMESSEKQATLGKMALGLRVTDLDGERIGFGKATGRFFGKIISGIILCIGYILAGFTERKQTLHDMMAGCLVVRGAHEVAAYEVASASQSSHRKHHKAFDLDDAFEGASDSSDGGGDSGGGGGD